MKMKKRFCKTILKILKKNWLILKTEIYFNSKNKMI